MRLWEKQEEVLTALTENHRVAVKAGNGLGKGFCAAVAVLWFMYAHRDQAIVLSTAPTFRQVRHILWRQIHRLYRPAAETLRGKMLDTRWELSDERYAMGLSADSADQFQGFHSSNMFIVVDEAEGVNDEIYEAIESVMTSADPLLLLIGNPTTMEGAFRRAFFEERTLYRAVTISALESPNVQAGRVVFPGLTTAKWVEERREIWGEANPIYRARVLGEFPEQGDDALMSLRSIEAAVGRLPPSPTPEGDGSEQVVLAVDVARFGSDRSVILRRRGDRVEDIQVLSKMDTMQLAARVAASIREYETVQLHIDEVGVGAGVVDRLRELGHPVRGSQRGQQGTTGQDVPEPAGRRLFHAGGTVQLGTHQHPLRQPAGGGTGGHALRLRRPDQPHQDRVQGRHAKAQPALSRHGGRADAGLPADGQQAAAVDVDGSATIFV